MFNNISELSFSREKKELIDAILIYFKEEPNQVEWVKDCEELPNCLSIPTSKFEKTLKGKNLPYFFVQSLRLVDGKLIPIKNISQFIDGFDGSQVFFKDHKSIKREVERRIANKEKLYINIVFEENILDYEDMFNAFYIMSETNEEIFDALIRSKKFPNWYGNNTDFSRDIIRIAVKKNELRDQERRELERIKLYLKSYIDIAAEKEERKLLKFLLEHYKIINNQLKEHKNKIID